jgi:hypothetical protein
LFLFISGFVVLIVTGGAWGLGSVVRNTIPLGFALGFLSAMILPGIRCPACKERFCGPREEGEANPSSNMFTSSCMYCHYSMKGAPAAGAKDNPEELLGIYWRRTASAYRAGFIIFGIFAFFGVAMLVTGGSRAYENISFSSRGLPAKGTVVRLVPFDADSTAATPVVRFTANSGSTYEFTSTTGSDPPSYRVGDSVAVLYILPPPVKAKINDFSSQWILPAGFGFLGTLGCALGFFGVARCARAAKRDWRLKKHGKTIAANVDSVTEISCTQKPARPLFKVSASWRDPANSRYHVFKRDDVESDISQYAGKQVNVLIDPADPKNYYIVL